MCLLNKHDKCNVSKLAVTIKIQYLCVLKVHRIKTAKQIKTNKKKPTLSSSQRGTNIQYKSILFKKDTNKNATK